MCLFLAESMVQTKMDELLEIKKKDRVVHHIAILRSLWKHVNSVTEDKLTACLSVALNGMCYAYSKKMEVRIDHRTTL